MEYTGIVEAWEKYLENNQKSVYMQRLSLKEDERLFIEGFKAGFDKREQKQDLVDLSDSEKQLSRVEIINHTQTDKEIGRIFIYYGEIELGFQDGGRTLKVFI